MASTVLQASETQRFSKSISGSVKSLLNSNDRTYFILEHKTKSDQHKVGESREFIGDYIELGRGDSYAVNYGNDCNTVSRPHAAIMRKANGWTIKSLSKTNPTLVNKNPISGEWYLSSGDEIQLSTNGPVIAFLIPANNKVGTMSLTIRMRAAINEAIKPYKLYIGTLVLIFAMVVAGGIYIIKAQSHKISDFEQKLVALRGTLDKKIDSAKKTVIPPPPPPPVLPAQPAKIQSLYPSVYFIESSKISYTIGTETKEKEYQISATGFLLNDGSFVTAHHVVEPWFYGDKAVDSLLNVIASNGGKVQMQFTAFSPDGTKINFTTDDFTVNKSDSEMGKITVDNKELNFRTPGSDANDWAVAKTDIKGKGLIANKSLSSSLTISTQLYILGYPFGRGANGENDIKPMYSDCKVSRDGLDKGIIDVGNKGFDHGNSGGPVFVKNSRGNFELVGIVSAEQGSQGFICPISALGN